MTSREPTSRPHVAGAGGGTAPPRKKLRILHIHHALYIPYLLSRGMRELGHRADTVYFDFGGASADLTWGCDFNLRHDPRWIANHLGFLLYALARYDIFHFWARPYLVPALFTIFNKHVPLDLALLKKAGKKVVFQSDGCYAMIRPSVWKTRVDPEICHTCQTTQGDAYGFCSNAHTIRLNAAMDRYADLRFGTGLGLDFEEKASFLFFPVDLERWHPDLQVPPEHRYHRQREGSLLIYHGVGSHVIGSRGNIKGTVWIREAVQDLQAEGYNLELMHVEGCPNSMVRFYQAQADIVVDQLLIGGGGQSSRECLALGKPVLTRIHPEQVGAFRRAAAPFEPPPYVPTDRGNLKENLRMLLDNAGLRLDIGRRSAEFARNVLSPLASARKFAEHYETLL